MKPPSRKFAILAFAVIFSVTTSFVFIGRFKSKPLTTTAQLSSASNPLSPATPASTTANEEQVKLRVQENFGKMPLYFIENKGQLDNQVSSYVQSSDKTLYFTPQGITYALTETKAPTQLPATSKPDSFLHPAAFELEAVSEQPQQRPAVKLDFIGANPNVQPEAPTEATFNYFKSKPEQWQTGLKTYAKSIYEALWPGIDLEYSGTANRLKDQFLVKPGAVENASQGYSVSLAADDHTPIVRGPSDNGGAEAAGVFAVPTTSSYTYTNGLGFGTDANGNVWNIWSANGSNIWDWHQNYVGGYLHYAFKIYNYSGFYCGGSCRYHNVWDKNPNLGFEISNVLGHDSGIFPESAQNNHKYHVDIQWNATGYHASVYDITAGSQYSDHDYTYPVNANTYDSWTWGYSLWSNGTAYNDEDASTHASQWTSTVYEGEATGTTGGGGDVRTDALPVVLPTLLAQFSQQGPKLVGAGAVGNASQGQSVSLSADGNTAIVGGTVDNGNAGAAWVWTRSGGIWTQQGVKLVGSGAVGAAQHGSSVSLSADGNTAIVGGDNDDSYSGAAWVWTRSGGVWTQQGTKLVGSGAVGPAHQGGSVSLSADGNTAIVGGSSDNNYSGAAWVWAKSEGVWTQQGAKLVGSGAVGTAQQGFSVSLSADGNTAIVGARSDSSPGAAWIWTRSGSVWTQQGTKLTGSGAVGNASQGFSVALSADGNTAIVGGATDNSNAGNAGAAWVWTRNGGIWTQQGTKLVGSGTVGPAQQGFSVSLSGDGNTAIVGGTTDNSQAGAAWVWTRSGGVWTQQGAKLVGSGTVGNAVQGHSVSLSADGNTAIVGGTGDNSSAGAAWVFTASSPGCASVAITTQPQNQAVPSGQTATLNVTASGTAPLSYQWYEGAKGDTSKPVGTHASSFTTPALTASKSYWVRVSNGCGTVDSEAASVLALPDKPPAGQGLLYGGFDSKLDTVVLTHGLSQVRERDDPLEELWIGNRSEEQRRQAGFILSDQLTGKVNVLRFVWDDAFQVTGLGIPYKNEYVKAREHVEDAGATLANILMKKLTPDYKGKIHFIGHSLGSIVSAYAANKYLNKATQVTEAQFTALDFPHNAHKLRGSYTCSNDKECTDEDFDKEYGFRSDFFAIQLESLRKRSNLTFRVDNFYTRSGLAGAGDITTQPDGIAWYNQELIKPNDVGGKFFEGEDTLQFYDNDHSGVHQWYRMTMNTGYYYTVFGNPICSGADFNSPAVWNKSLNPCQKGWYWSIVNPNRGLFPGSTLNPIKFNDKTLALANFSNINGCQQQSGSVSCQRTTPTAIAARKNSAAVEAASNPAYATISLDLPAGAKYVSFDYKFSNIGVGDYASLFIGDQVIWSLNSSNFAGSDFANSGPIPINGYTGVQTFTIGVFGSSVANTTFEIRNFTGIVVNNPPIVYAPGLQAVKVGEMLVLNADARDDDGDVITFGLLNAPTGATINSSTGALNWMPNQSQIGTHSFTIKVTDNSADKLYAEQAVNVIVLQASGYEGDVAPRPSGNNNGTVTIADWVQLGRFSAGIETPAIGSEFQRADCAPRATFGDGKITLSDWVQAGRYAAGLDSIAAVAGEITPLSFASNAITNVEALTSGLGATRLIRAMNANFQRGQIGILQIELEGQGNENAAAFSLNFDPKQLSFVDAILGNGANGAALQVNKSQATTGRVGFALALPAGQQLAAGTRTLLTLRFIPNGGDGDVVTNINFSDQLLAREIVDAWAAPIAQVSYAGGTITIRGRAAANVSAASYVDAELAADSIASAFGTGLATMTTGAVSLPLPNTLGGTAVRVRDALGVERIAPLFFVSPTQINYQIPAGTADGIAAVTITNGAGEVTAGLLNIARVAPGLFAADASGKGWAAADVVSVASDGSQTLTQAARFDVGQNKFVAVPIDVTSNAAVLVLYGTGIRQRSDLGQVKVKVGGVDAAVEYAGAQASYAGLDQVNVRLPKSLAGGGVVNVELIIEGKAANPLRILMK